MKTIIACIVVILGVSGESSAQSRFDGIVVFATSSAAVTNYAVGAARSYNDGINVNLTRQVDAFLGRSGGVASSRALYVIEMGGNDIRDAFQVYAFGGDS